MSDLISIEVAEPDIAEGMRLIRQEVTAENKALVELALELGARAAFMSLRLALTTCCPPRLNRSDVLEIIAAIEAECNSLFD